MKNTTERIEEIKNHGYELDFSETFNKAFEIYKKIALSVGILYLLMTFIVFGFLITAFFLIFGFSEISDMRAFDITKASANFLLAYVVIATLIGALLGPINAGILKIAHQADRNENFSLGTAFEYYKQPYFSQIFIATVLISLVSVGLNMLLNYLGMALVAMLITYLTAFFTMLAIPLVIFGNLPAVDAIKGSFIVVSKNPAIILGLLIVGIIASMIGVIAFCIGIFFTIPLLSAMYYSIYVNSVGLGEENKGISDNYTSI